jgi:hypothetical protein
MQSVGTMLYSLIGLGFDYRLLRWFFLLTESFRPHCGPDVVSAP